MHCLSDKRIITLILEETNTLAPALLQRESEQQADTGKKVDIVYPLGSGSKHDNLELRFSLRSIERYLHDYRNIYIIGVKPKWLLTGEFLSDDGTHKVIHIPFTDYKQRSENVFNKLMHISNMPDVTDDFLLMNDDFFFIHARSAADYKFYYRGEIADWLKTAQHSAYKQTIENTYRALIKRGVTTYNYAVHKPLLIYRQAFTVLMDDFDFRINGGYSVRSLYCNLRVVGGELIDDPKINRPRTEKHLGTIPYKYGDSFSVNDRALNKEMIAWMQGYYPWAAPYENYPSEHPGGAKGAV
jgi:hypothetical protein